jgi:hypothetical protein
MDFRYPAWTVSLNIFLAVLIMGTLWRLISQYLTASDSDAVSHLGRAMAYQYG